MAGKGKWLSKVRRFLLCCRKDVSVESGKRTGRERRKGQGKPTRGKKNYFVSLFKKPTSSIEKILEDAQTKKGLTSPPPLEQPKKASVLLPKASASSPKVASPRSATPKILSPKATSPRASSLRVVIPRAPSPRALSPKARSNGDVFPDSPKASSPIFVSPKATSPRFASARVAPPFDVSSTISPSQPSSFRRSFSKAASLKEIHTGESISRIEPIFPYHHVAATKIQAAYRGYMSRMSTGAERGLVRLQRFVKGQNVMRQTANSLTQMQLVVHIKNQLTSQKFQTSERHALQHEEQCISDKQAESVASDEGNSRSWDASILSKEAKEAVNKRKEDAVRNKERAMKLVQSHQMSKFTLESAKSALMDQRIDGRPWSWNLPEHHLLNAIHPGHKAKKKVSLIPRYSASLRGNQYLTPSRFSQEQTPDGTSRPNSSSGSLLSKYSKPARKKSQSQSEINFTDTDSLRSSTAYSVPHYMSPTASTLAKMRFSNNFNDSVMSSPSEEYMRRLSYPLTPGSRNSSSRGPLFPDNDASSQRSNLSSRFMNNLTESRPGSSDGRKPFNRFV